MRSGQPPDWCSEPSSHCHREKNLFGQVLARELHGSPRDLHVDRLRTTNIEDIVDEDHLLKSCVLLGFSRVDADVLVSYSSVNDSYFLELWHFRGVGQRVQLACRSELFRAEDGPSSQGDWDSAPLVVTVAEDGGGNCLVVHGQQAEGEAEGGVPLRNFVTVIPLPVDTYRAATLRGAHWSYITSPPHPPFDAAASMGCPGFLLLPTACELTALQVSRRRASSQRAGGEAELPGRREGGASCDGDEETAVPGIAYTESLWSPPKPPRPSAAASSAAGSPAGQAAAADAPAEPRPSPGRADSGADPPADLCEASVSQRAVFDAEAFISRMRLCGGGENGGGSGSGSGSSSPAEQQGRPRVIDYHLQLALASPQPAPFALLFLAVALERAPPAGGASWGDESSPMPTPLEARREISLLGLAASFDLRTGESQLLHAAPLRAGAAAQLGHGPTLERVLGATGAAGAESIRRRGAEPRSDASLPHALSNAAALATMTSFSAIRHPTFPLAVLGYGAPQRQAAD